MNRATARRHGAALLRRMKGTGWTLAVWENMGWHYAVTNGTLTVYASEHAMVPTTYHALISGFHSWTNTFSSTDPNEVVKNQLEIAEDVVKYLATVVNEVRANVKKKKGRK